MFHIGQEVVCVDDEHNTRQKMPLIKGAHYIIRDIGVAPFARTMNVDVEGIPNSMPELGPRWRASRFRPIQRKTTDISIFEALLNTKKVSEDA